MATESELQWAQVKPVLEHCKEGAQVTEPLPDFYYGQVTIMRLVALALDPENEPSQRIQAKHTLAAIARHMHEKVPS